MITAALLDDNAAWLERGRRALVDFAHERGAEIAISCYSSAQEMLSQQQVAPDVLFTDIELGGKGNGIELAKDINETWPSCCIVYVTNYLEYALDVYATKHVWYMLKSDFERRLPEVYDKLVSLLEDGKAQFVVRTTDRRLVTVRCLDVVSIERRGRVTILSMVDGQQLSVPNRLVELLGHMPATMFARSHASFAANLSHVRQVGKDMAVLDNEMTVPLSKRYGPAFRNAFLTWADSHMV